MSSSSFSRLPPYAASSRSYDAGATTTSVSDLSSGFTGASDNARRATEESGASDTSSYSADAFSLYGLEWVLGDEACNTIIVSHEINASADRVWAAITDVAKYASYSDGLATAELENGHRRLRVGRGIILGIHPELGCCRKALCGSQLGRSVEEVTVVDPENYALCWRKPIPCTCGARSERWQVIVPDLEGGRCTLYAALRVPGLPGAMSKWLLGDEIRSAFAALGDGVKRRAERTRRHH